MVLILDGKKVRDIHKKALIRKIRAVSQTSHGSPKLRPFLRPKLLIIQIGNIEESNVYIKHKKLFARKIGILVLHKKYSPRVSEKFLLSEIKRFNGDKKIHGIIVQLPLSRHLNEERIINAIDHKKDVDGLTKTNMKKFSQASKKDFQKKSEFFIPATTLGIISLLAHYKINLKGKKMAMIGRSALVGIPTTIAFRKKGAKVALYDERTKNISEKSRIADILVVAVGKKNLVTGDFTSKKQVVIDVGINVMPKLKRRSIRKVWGDVDFKNVKKIVRAITPVPGGVGPMTVVSLFENLFDAYKLQTEI